MGTSQPEAVKKAPRSSISESRREKKMGEFKYENAVQPSVVAALNTLAEHVYSVSSSKGFHDDDIEDVLLDEGYEARYVANLHGEVSELWEAYRNGTFHTKCDKVGLELTCAEEELADILIRTLDTARALKIDIGHAVREKDAYNQGRSFRHGGKKA
jgi:NTP pyrophosphatase (non-canonical NTP hydrolase)